MKRHISLFICAVLLLSLAACGSDNIHEPEPTRRERQPTTESTPEISIQTFYTPENDIVISETVPSLYDYYKSLGDVIVEELEDFKNVLLVYFDNATHWIIQFNTDDKYENLISILSYLSAIMEDTTNNNSFIWAGNDDSIIVTLDMRFDEYGNLVTFSGLMWDNEEYENLYDNLINSVDDYEQEYIILYDANDIFIELTSIAETRTGGIKLNVYIENNSEYDCYIRTEKFSANDFQMIVSGTWHILSGKKANENIEIYSSVLKENNMNISDVMKYEFVFSVRPTDGENFESDVIVIIP